MGDTMLDEKLVLKLVHMEIGLKARLYGFIMLLTKYPK
jgi:hypothetical protein